MLRSKLNNLVEPKTIQVIEWIELKSGHTEFNFIKVKQKNKKLLIESEAHDISSFDELISLVSDQDYLILLISGAKVLHKKLAEFTDNPLDSFSQYFPGSAPQDFMIQSYRDHTNQWLFLARNDYLLDVIQKLSAVPHEIRLGPLDALQTLPLLDTPLDPMNFGIHSIDSSGNYILRSDILNDNHVALGAEEILTSHLPLFGASLQRFLNRDSQIFNQPDHVTLEGKSWLENKKINLLKWSVLLTLLGLLLINFIAFNSVNQKNQRLSSKLNLLKGEQQSLKNRQALEQSGISYLSTNGWTDEKKISFYMDRLATTIPSTVRLTQLNVFPVEKPDRQKSQAVNNRNKITIQGISTNLETYNLWMNSLTTLDWVDGVEITNYAEDGRSAEFEAVLVLE